MRIRKRFSEDSIDGQMIKAGETCTSKFPKIDNKKN